MQASELRLIFQLLSVYGYEWQPQTPDLLVKHRKQSDPFSPLVKIFGLGLSIPISELNSLNFSNSEIQILKNTSFIKINHDSYIQSDLAIWGAGSVYSIHDHWPPKSGEEHLYVHAGFETAWMARQIQREIDLFIDKSVLDLGCSSGALLFEVIGVCKNALGVDISKRAIEFAQVSTAALGYRNLNFITYEVGGKLNRPELESKKWDLIISNPPMVVPAKDAKYPHRDGGSYGVELPLKFIDFASRHLNDEGQILTLATNPIVSGRSYFFDRLDLNYWEMIEKKLLHPYFNQSVASKQGYKEQNIERVELYYIHLAKRLS